MGSEGGAMGALNGRGDARWIDRRARPALHAYFSISRAGLLADFGRVEEAETILRSVDGPGSINTSTHQAQLLVGYGRVQARLSRDVSGPDDQQRHELISCILQGLRGSALHDQGSAIFVACELLDRAWSRP